MSGRFEVGQVGNIWWDRGAAALLLGLAALPALLLLAAMAAGKGEVVDPQVVCYVVPR